MFDEDNKLVTPYFNLIPDFQEKLFHGQLESATQKHLENAHDVITTSQTYRENLGNNITR